MSFIWDWFWYQVPFWVQFFVILGIVGVPVLLIGMMVFGVKPTIQVIGTIIGVAAIIAAASKFRQEGYRQRLDEEDKALDKAGEVVDEKRDEIERLPETEVDKRLDRWS